MKQTLLIPRAIAEWIEYCKSRDIPLYGALEPNDGYDELIADSFKGDLYTCAQWAKLHSDDFAYAWVKGYSVMDKHYYIAIPCGNDTYRRAFVDSRGKLVIGNFTYTSEKDIAKISKDANVKLTEKVIKESELAWVWQFAKELEL